MPTYGMKCDAGHRFDVTCGFSSLPSRCRMPGCDCACQQDWAAKNIIGCVKRDRSLGDKHLSVTKFYHPKQARAMAEALGDVGKRCIKPDGSVVYEHRGDARKFRKAEEAWKRRELQRAHDNEGKAAARESVAGSDSPAAPNDYERKILAKARARPKKKNPRLGTPRTLT